MNIYLISQSRNTELDAYDAAVVVADSENEARQIHPSGNSGDAAPEGNQPFDETGVWTSVDNVSVKFIGIAHPDLPKGVVLSSFIGA